MAEAPRPHRYDMAKQTNKHRKKMERKWSRYHRRKHREDEAAVADVLRANPPHPEEFIAKVRKAAGIDE
jgi:hypothetical protein